MARSGVLEKSSAVIFRWGEPAALKFGCGRAEMDALMAAGGRRWTRRLHSKGEGNPMDRQPLVVEINWRRHMAPVERETVVVNRGGGGPGGVIIGVILALVLLVVGYLVFFNNNGGGGGTLDIDVPAVSVDVAPDGQ